MAEIIESEKRLSFFGHIGELRNRLLRSVVVVALAIGLCFAFYNQIFEVLTFPSQGIEFYAYEMLENMGTIMRVCLFGGIILAIPYLTYEFIMFVTPALTPREKKYVYIILPWIALMFAVGVIFGYYIIVPRMVDFLISFGSEIAITQIRISSYINIATRILLVSGLIFELPVVVTFLARIGVVSPAWLSSKWRIAIILSCILAAMITPTIDPINMLLVAMPLIVLYFLSIWLAKLVYKKKATEETPADAADLAE